VQVVAPDLTESYGSSTDPPELSIADHHGVVIIIIIIIIITTTIIVIVFIHSICLPSHVLTRAGGSAGPDRVVRLEHRSPGAQHC
jgi:hypothetical protein